MTTPAEREEAARESVLSNVIESLANVGIRASVRSTVALDAYRDAVEARVRADTLAALRAVVEGMREDVTVRCNHTEDDACACHFESTQRKRRNALREDILARLLAAIDTLAIPPETP